MNLCLMARFGFTDNTDPSIAVCEKGNGKNGCCGCID